MFNKNKVFVINIVSAVLVVFALISPGIASADSATQAVAQGYSSTSPLQPGIIVSLASNNSGSVAPLNINNIKAMLGVVVSYNQASITLGNQNANNQVFVTNYGQHDVLVSNQNGPITTGDYITISNISGVGMKADGNEPIVLGQAAGSFDGVNNIEGTASIKNSNGKSVNVNLGLIPVDISIANNPLAAGPQGLPTVLNNVSKFATNKSVSAVRVYVALFVAVIGLIMALTIIYSAIKNGIVAMGRNPLARRSIIGGMVRVIAVGVIVFAISLGASYAILL